ncbi:hypothetical protein DXA92_05740 [Agathobaculum butyriciproducens]|nr:hypothetical protein DXA94_11210 [Agathobaculum butyriciproducens]RGC61833.1 hypothetical protein DXA92_05740 [Agathobaculum butyriciproducens]
MILNNAHITSTNTEIETVIGSSMAGYYAVCAYQTDQGEIIPLPQRLSTGEKKVLKNSYMEVPDTIGGFPIKISPKGSLEYCGKSKSKGYSIWKVISDFAVLMDD